MHVQALWRHPVKSLRGESLAAADITEDGLRGDRRWGIRDEATGMVLTARREPSLLDASAALAVDEAVEITLPDGTTMTGGDPATDAALTNWLGHDVTLLHAADSPGGHAEFFADATDDSSEAIEWTMPVGRFVDAMPILLLTNASLRAGAALYSAATGMFGGSVRTFWSTPTKRAGSKMRGATASFASARSNCCRVNRVSVARWSRDHNPTSIVTSTSTRPLLATTRARSAYGPLCKHRE